MVAVHALGATTSRRLVLQPLLGCNVYISAGGCQRHIPILLDLLKGTQERCSQSTTCINSGDADNSGSGVCVVVHAFADVVYNRSSIHLAATSEDLMTTVVSDLVQKARRELLLLNTKEEANNSNNNTQEESVAHPSVGLVDHVSVIPLLTTVSKEKEEDNTTNNIDDYKPMTPWGRTARAIGIHMVETSNQNVNVLFYGDADPHQTPLAEVRRHKTHFFQSGGLEKESSDSQHQETATVGAPLNFVENFNIRLTAKCDKKLAQSLTRAVRERNGGVPGVEALTLPYSHGRHEVACNLLHPNFGGSVQDIQKKIEEWVSEAIEERKDLVETAYRVGTTSDQCLKVLELASNGDTLEKHNTLVSDQFKDYLTQ